MSERKMHTRYLPLRVRIRPSSEAGQHPREQTGPLSENALRPPAVGQHRFPDLSHASPSERHAQQVKELLRLSALLRSDGSLDALLPQIAASMAACTGFRVIVISILDESAGYLRPIAFAGITEEDQRVLYAHPFSAEVLSRIMRPEFRISQSYFVPSERADIFNDMPTARSGNGSERMEREADNWHPEDTLMVPLYSPREQKILGCLSLDDPESGKIPAQEAVEIIELFANNAAGTIDNLRLAHERASWEEGVAALDEQLERVRRGDLSSPIHVGPTNLQTATDTINKLLQQATSVLLDTQKVTKAVDEHTRNVQHNAEVLARDTKRQEVQVSRIAQVITDFAHMMKTISDRAAVLIHKAHDAVEVKNEAQSTNDRVIEGMNKVRDAIMQSARTMKNLSESGQEINETISMSNDLAMRMHLLALNAAIEASRAGEHGQGFATIAQEMRTLATQSTDAARKVNSYIRIIQQETSSVSLSVEQSTQTVITETERVMASAVALDTIGVVIDELTNLIQGIFTTVENQPQRSQAVINAINEITKMAGDANLHMQELQQSTQDLVESTNALRARMALIQTNERL